jgi:hypothetical protein
MSQNLYNGASLLGNAKLKVYNTLLKTTQYLSLKECYKRKECFEQGTLLSVYKGNHEPIIIEKNDKDIGEYLYTVQTLSLIPGSSSLYKFYYGERHNLITNEGEKSIFPRKIINTQIPIVFDTFESLEIPFVLYNHSATPEIQYVQASIVQIENKKKESTYEIYFNPIAKTILFELRGGFVQKGVKLRK